MIKSFFTFSLILLLGFPGSSCPYDGQFYDDCGWQCLATCTDPFPPCVLLCSPGCHCPTDQVVNENTGSCVPLEECPGQFVTASVCVCVCVCVCVNDINRLHLMDICDVTYSMHVTPQYKLTIIARLTCS